MRERVAIARQLKDKSKRFFKGSEAYKIALKCYRAYLIQCVIGGREKFEISYGARYIQSFSERIYEWYRYIVESIVRFFLIHFAPNIYKKRLWEFDGLKPLHVKFAKIPDEDILYNFLEENGFKITEEHVYSTSTTYDVERA